MNFLLVGLLHIYLHYEEKQRPRDYARGGLQRTLGNCGACVTV